MMYDFCQWLHHSTPVLECAAHAVRGEELLGDGRGHVLHPRHDVVDEEEHEALPKSQSRQRAEIIWEMRRDHM